MADVAPPMNRSDTMGSVSFGGTRKASVISRSDTFKAKVHMPHLDEDDETHKAVKELHDHQEELEDKLREVDQARRMSVRKTGQLHALKKEQMSHRLLSTDDDIEQCPKDKLVADYRQMTHDYEERIKILEELVEEKETNLGLASSIGEELLEDNKSFELTVQHLEQQIHNHVTEMHEAELRLEDVFEDMAETQERNEQMREQLASQTAQMESMQELIDAHEEEGEHDSAEVTNMKVQLQTAQKNAARWEEEKHNVEDDNLELQNHLAMVASELDTSKHVIASQKDQLKSLQQRLDKAGKRDRQQNFRPELISGAAILSARSNGADPAELTKLKAEVVMLQNDMEIMEQRNADKDEEIKDLEDQLYNIEKRSEKLLDQVNSLLQTGKMPGKSPPPTGDGLPRNVSSAGVRARRLSTKLDEAEHLLEEAGQQSYLLTVLSMFGGNCVSNRKTPRTPSNVAVTDDADVTGPALEAHEEMEDAVLAAGNRLSAKSSDDLLPVTAATAATAAPAPDE